MESNWKEGKDWFEPVLNNLYVQPFPQLLPQFFAPLKHFVAKKSSYVEKILRGEHLPPSFKLHLCSYIYQQNLLPLLMSHNLCCY